MNKLIEEKKIALNYVHIDPNEINEVGDYDLAGLFIRLDRAIKSIGAKRIL
ncbi:MAG: hypothetical protein HQK57_13035 [Deltaproteobacteria bacterium]|nr:hypothetical protein [Deltaproteobacteria bacterium]